MPPSRRGRSTVEERVLTELTSIRASVTGVHGSLAATIDGLLVAHDLPDSDPAQVAALVSSTFALASQATLMTGRGQFREAVTRGGDGYLAVYAAGRNAIVAVIGTSTLNVALLQYQARAIIERVAEYSEEFRKWSVPAQGRPGERAAPAAASGARRVPAGGVPGAGAAAGVAGTGAEAAAAAAAAGGGAAAAGAGAAGAPRSQPRPRTASPAPLPVRRPATRRGS